MIEQTEFNGGVFTPKCTALSVYQKVRTIVLYIQASDERRRGWKKICSIYIPLDVETRWNALFNMMWKAREHSKEITVFARQFPALKHLVPTDVEWEKCAQVERALEPFYNHTLSISNSTPSLNETVGIMWGLDDLFDDIRNKENLFEDVDPNIQAAFEAGMAELEKYQQLIRENDLYYVAHILDLQIKMTLIKKEYSEHDVDEIIK